MNDRDLQGAQESIIDQLSAMDEPILGDVNGEPAYGYTRIATLVEMDSITTRLHHRLERLHLIACAHHVHIPRTQLYTDIGYSGYEYEGRPGLMQLRQDMAKVSGNKLLVIEDFDRLTRNSEHLSRFLLELTAANILVHFRIDGTYMDGAIG
ncbi:recombinase family protein [Chloroflexi bacterium TSY]|nr:recombinase family protein [Chloroflexi bacterium TSY]